MYNLLSKLVLSSGSSDPSVSHSIDKLLGCAIPVDPERMSLPKRAAVLDPCDILPPDKVAILKDLDSLLLPHPRVDELREVFFNVDPKLEKCLRSRMYESGICTATIRTAVH